MNKPNTGLVPHPCRLRVSGSTCAMEDQGPIFLYNGYKLGRNYPAVQDN